MSSRFVPRGLVEAPFVERLLAWLEEARAAVGAELLAVAELSAAAGQLAPAWRAQAGRMAPSSSLTGEQFRALTTPRTPAETNAAILVDLATMLGFSRVVAIPLVVTPTLSSAPDALLVAGFPTSAIPDALLTDFRIPLETGLSADRRARLADTVLQAIDQAPDAIELTDREGRLFYANAAWERRFGYFLQDVAGRTVGSLFRDPAAPLHDAAFYQFTMNTLASGRAWLGTIVGRTSAGQRVISEVNVGPFTADGAGFRGNVAVRRDVAHRVQRDEALAVAHREFSSVLSAVPDGVAVLREGKIYFVNAAFLRMLQLPEEQVIGRAYADLIHPDDRGRFAVEHHDGVARVRMMDAEGLPRLAEISAAGAVSYEGEQSMILLSRDTTDYHVARQRLTHADKLAAVGSLASGIAHEINNPLAFLTLNIESLRKNAAPMLSADDREAIDDALDGARRIRQIVGNLNAFSRSDKGGKAPPVDLEKAITSAIGIAQNEIRHRVIVERDLEASLAVAVDEGQIVQVLVNVLVNAAQATWLDDAPTGTISVRASSAGARVEVVIVDTGVGIPASLLPRVFEPFFSGKPNGERAGLGLAISKQIVHSFSGTITIASEVGQGTAVTITVPRGELPDDQRVSVTSTLGVSAPARRRARILIVDNDNSVAGGLRQSLSHHLVEIADGARAALERLASDPTFDVVLCDLVMPQLSGSDLHRRICAVHPRLLSRFIFMTSGSASERALLPGKECRVLEKPFDVERLERYVQDVAEQSERLVSDEGLMNKAKG